MTAGMGGVFGSANSMSGTENGTDFYAPDDARNPFGMGTYTRDGKVKKHEETNNKKKRKKRTKKSSNVKNVKKRLVNTAL